MNFSPGEIVVTSIRGQKWPGIILQQDDPSIPLYKQMADLETVVLWENSSYSTVPTKTLQLISLAEIYTTLEKNNISKDLERAYKWALNMNAEGILDVLPPFQHGIDIQVTKLQKQHFVEGAVEEKEKSPCSMQAVRMSSSSMQLVIATEVGHPPPHGNQPRLEIEGVVLSSSKASYCKEAQDENGFLSIIRLGAAAINTAPENGPYISDQSSSGLDQLTNGSTPKDKPIQVFEVDIQASCTLSEVYGGNQVKLDNKGIAKLLSRGAN
ncbi:hypothetical protein GG344DRAFT_71000 [Lentinula edodes]|nr:hypothetical protein GG344DRAFT_71000 [Lentinula edodes]